jgi:hypothetical protein
MSEQEQEYYSLHYAANHKINNSKRDSRLPLVPGELFKFKPNIPIKYEQSDLYLLSR